MMHHYFYMFEAKCNRFSGMISGTDAATAFDALTKELQAKYGKFWINKFERVE